MMKFVLYIPVLIFGMAGCCSCSGKNSCRIDDICFVSNQRVLDNETSLIICGFTFSGDEVDLRAIKYLPIICNTSQYGRDDFLLSVEVYSVDFPVEINDSYDIADASIDKEYGYKYTLYYNYKNNNKMHIGPFQELPFPVTKIPAQQNTITIPMIIRYGFPDSHNEARLCLVGFSEKLAEGNGPDKIQQQFLYLVRGLINGINPSCISLIFNESVVSPIRNIKPLMKQDIAIDNIMELQ